jgi:diguanylate cyclase (GGDEF)-like protein/PAS domain S-box-containing protein/putative nucleotidyltransferase with HDIG domain
MINKKTLKLESGCQKIINAFNDTVWLINTSGKIIDVNQRAAEQLGYTKEELIGSPLYKIDKNMTEKNILDLINNLPQDELQIFESIHLTKAGREIPVEVSSTIIEDNREQIIISIARDISRRKEQEAKIKYMTFHDQLTGLYNRHYIEDLHLFEEKGKYPISIIIADLNDLKLINDSWGHQKGDEIIKKAAEIISSSCREEDIIARIGGDEFLVFLPETEESTAVKIAERIKNIFVENDSGMDISFSVAVGVASKSFTEDYKKVLKQAEEKMFINKKKTKVYKNRNLIASALDDLQNKRDESRQHLNAVQKYSLMLAKKLNLKKEKIKKLEFAALYHDLGKIFIPEEILMKEEKLNSSDWEIIKLHSDFSDKLLKHLNMDQEIQQAVKHHHELWNGSGYPDGLSKLEIPLFSRIIAVADAFSVMTLGKVYKNKMAVEEAKEELIRCSATQFDPTLVDLFVELISENELN